MQALFAKTALDHPMRSLDARTKLIVTVVTAVMAVAISGFVGQMTLFVLSLVYVLGLRRPGLLLVLYGASAVMMLFAAGFAALLGLWIPQMGGLSVKNLFIPFMRGLTMMNVVLVLAMTTRVEDLLSTLEKWRLPFFLFLPLSVMLRFIPTFMNDIRQIWETLKIRGWPMGPAMLFMRPILSARLLLAPILFRALKTSETLGMAAELKGLGACETTNLAPPARLSRADRQILVVLALTCVAAVLGDVFFKDLFITSGIGMP